MSARVGYYFMLAAGCFVTGLGHYVVGPAIVVLSQFYRERIVAVEEHSTLRALQQEDRR